MPAYLSGIFKIILIYNQVKSQLKYLFDKTTNTEDCIRYKFHNKQKNNTIA